MTKVEQYIKDYTRNCSNEMIAPRHEYQPWLTPDHAREVAKVARKETIDKACEWFRTLDDKEPPYDTTEEFIEDFRKAMED